MNRYIPFVIFFFSTLLIFIIILGLKKTKHNIFLYCASFIYLNCVWWLILHPNSSFGVDYYYMPHFFFKNAKIVYKVCGLTDPSTFLNITMTIPAGIMIHLYLKNWLNVITVILCAIMIGFFNEGTQFLFDILFNLNRTVDITDVCTNSLGVLIGYIMTKYGVNSPTS
ncbi:VanZ family protein [Pediococcus argentinicus]|uniref:VanZ-like domain-containing protein n=1 Tax=Pediococcus argentinicus TaxID=480391 RepID=A0A0R2N8M3_9LACO|nr:VanZ family protein [Pediococcus argentinicus]KRO22177.1 hypothetical protein IV88_GL001273 [Pediococcus argentinicus]NKZ22502.1 VanZ family protein [Pediococcus argentinicus]GEP20191.1 hypothetical protein LSA03_15750 [Pediococcus argentinicus]